MSISFEEIGHLAVTFGAGAEVKAGQVCRVSGNGTVDICADGDDFCGVAELVRRGHAAVQVEGFASVGCTGALETGYVNLCADGNGGVKAGGSHSYLVVSVDEATQTAVIKL